MRVKSTSTGIEVTITLTEKEAMQLAAITGGMSGNYVHGGPKFNSTMYERLDDIVPDWHKYYYLDRGGVERPPSLRAGPRP